MKRDSTWLGCRSSEICEIGSPAAGLGRCSVPDEMLQNTKEKNYYGMGACISAKKGTICAQAPEKHSTGPLSTAVAMATDQLGTRFTQCSIPQNARFLPMACSSLLLRVRHAGGRLVGLLLDAAAGEEALAVGRLLVLLGQVAAPAAARRGEVDEAAALQVVLVPEVGALEGGHDDVAGHAARRAEEEALGRVRTDT